MMANFCFVCVAHTHTLTHTHTHTHQVSIDGQAVRGLGMAEIQALLTGRTGSKALLNMLRPPAAGKGAEVASGGKFSCQVERLRVCPYNEREMEGGKGFFSGWGSLMLSGRRQ